jgi:hypothetical protein
MTFCVSPLAGGMLSRFYTTKCHWNSGIMEKWNDGEKAKNLFIQYGSIAMLIKSNSLTHYSNIPAFHSSITPRTPRSYSQNMGRHWISRGTIFD